MPHLDLLYQNIFRHGETVPLTSLVTKFIKKIYNDL
jgi:hypothetical protein